MHEAWIQAGSTKEMLCWYWATERFEKLADRHCRSMAQFTLHTDWLDTGERYLISHRHGMAWRVATQLGYTVCTSSIPDKEAALYSQASSISLRSSHIHILSDACAFLITSFNSPPSYRKTAFHWSSSGCRVRTLVPTTPRLCKRRKDCTQDCRTV